MKHLKSFKIFEAEFYEEDSKYQRKKAVADAKRKIKVATPESGVEISRNDLKTYNPVKYTDVPLDVFLKRKEKGVEDEPEKVEKAERKKRKDEYDINDLRKAISNSDGMVDFRRKYISLWNWYIRNKSTVSEIEFEELNRKDLEKTNLKKFAEEQKQKEKELIQADKIRQRLEKKERQYKERQEIIRLNKIDMEFNLICKILIDNPDLNYYENFKLIYPKKIEWLKENNLLERFIFYFDYKEGVNGLEVIKFSDDFRSRLNELKFTTQPDLSMSKKSFNGRKIDIFNLRFKDIDKRVFLAVIDGNELPLLFTHTQEDNSSNDLSSTIDYLENILLKENDSL